MGTDLAYHPEALAKIRKHQEKLDTKEKPTWALLQEILVEVGFQDQVLPASGAQLTRAKVKAIYNKVMIFPVVEPFIQCNNSSKVS